MEEVEWLSVSFAGQVSCGKQALLQVELSLHEDTTASTAAPGQLDEDCRTKTEGVSLWESIE